MARNESTNQIEIQAAIIRDELGNELIDFSKQIVTGRISLGILEFVESLTTPSIKGIISVDSSRGEFDKLQLVGNETIEFTMKTPGTDDESDYIIETPKFKIYDFDESTHYTDLSLTPEGQRPRSITIRFVGQQSASILEYQSPVPYGFVGRIANEEKIDSQNISSNDRIIDEGDTVGFNEDDTGDETEDTCKGLINELAKSYFRGDNFEIEKTDNTIFISPKRVTYPNKSFTRNMNLLQLINYSANYAWRKNLEITDSDVPEGDDSTYPDSTYGWSNYFFWQDLKGWHFRSIASLAVERSKEDIKEFSFTQNLLDNSRLFKFEVISDFSLAKAFSDGILYSYYSRIEPNYMDPYARFLDDDQKFKTTNFEYNYGTDYTPIIGKTKFLPDLVFDPLVSREVSLSEFIVNRANPELELKDSLFGYYNNRSYRDDKQLTRLIGFGHDVGSPSFYGVLESNEANPALCDYNLYQDNMWQEMFDCVNVMEPSNSGGESGSSGDVYDDCAILKKLKQIKAESFLAKLRYKKAMDYKERWNIYRYSVCCEDVNTTEDEFFAIIKDHKKIADNIYRYAWSKVVLIPKVELAEIVGWKHFLTEVDIEGGISSDSSYYNLEVAGELSLNALFLYDDFNGIYWTPHWREFTGGNIISAPFGIYSGKIYFGASGGGSEAGPSGPTGSIAFDYVRPLFTGVSAEGLTLTFHNSQYSPFLVVEREDGPKGSTNDYTGAYNLNEIMNRTLLPVGTNTDQGEYPESFAGVTGVIYYQHSPIDYPINGDYGFSGPTFTDEILIGPGIQGTGDTGGYPDGFDMMPIGGYKRLRANRTPECKATPFGHIVKMSSVSYEEALQVGIEPRNFPVPVRDKRLFYFAAENAHDGNCQGECEL